MTPRSVCDFEEGVLILEPFFWSNVLFKICFFCIKSHDWGKEEFLWVPSPDCNAAELRNECVSLFMLSSFYKARANTYTRRSQTMEIFGMTFETEVANFENDIASLKNGHRIQTPSSKLMILVSTCWKKNFIPNNGHSLFILSLVFLNSLIVSVAFCLGHPV